MVNQQSRVLDRTSSKRLPVDVVKRLDEGRFSGKGGMGGWWNTFLAFFSMEVCTMETRRVNGMSALLTSVACAVDYQ